VRSLTTQDAIHQTNMKEIAECKELFSQLVRYRGELQQMHQKVEAAMETLKKDKAFKEVRYSLQKKKKKILQRKLENTHCPCG
jgi:chromosome segregation ATPase